ncbi:uncharacterized protein LOC121878668 [Homarus americanus]|uniref:uncharacterized protein LOC121878668 n=1 Tax=Homarus americanus TaxID=6706 RepID=UPI001C493106|nr:uncharacterized protein LOC121878668 [Homarus americanus]
MDLISTGNDFFRRGDIALANFGKCVKVVDAILVWDSSYGEHVQRVREILLWCRQHGITMNRSKFVFATKSVQLCGFGVSAGGVRADSEKIKAIAEFAVPTNITDLWSFLGLVNQLADFTPSIASAADKLRTLLTPKYEFVWTPEHQSSFQTVKQALSTTPVLAHFDLALPTMLQTDASRLKGLGYVLLQQHVIDHKPLVPIINEYTIDLRFHRLKEKTVQFTYKAVWRKGVDHAIPDSPSHAPVDDPSSAVCWPEHWKCHRGLAAISETSMTYVRLLLYDAVALVFPMDRKKVPPALWDFWKIRDSLSIDEGLHGACIVIPAAARRNGLYRLHDSYRGKEATKRKSCQTLWWPGITSDIVNNVQSCNACQTLLPFRVKKPLMCDPPPPRPFEDASKSPFPTLARTTCFT